MNKKTLSQLYAEHIGKSSDKWSLYLNEYNRLFESYRDMPIRLLEVGVQNGGSLEIWSKYFSNASTLIGCDINPECGNLNFDDPRIAIIIGDANASAVQDRVLKHSSQFDLIIDDGSHSSSDIIKSFALYFSKLVEGGIYTIEDLHCSYWENFEGGLFDPYSSISFFKRLADVINHEHWGISKTRSDILSGIFAKYGCSIGVDVLSQVHSVEFINSMCVVRKAAAHGNSLGHRVIAGTVATVVTGHEKLNKNPYQLDPVHDQSNNPWTTRVTPPDEAIQMTESALNIAKMQIVKLNETIRVLKQQLSNLSNTVSAYQESTSRLKETISVLEQQASNLSHTVSAYQESTSWRLTQPIRLIGTTIKRIRKIIINSINLFGNFKRLVNKLVDKKLELIEHHLTLLQSPDYAAQFSRDRGFSPKLIKVLIKFGVAFFKIKKWWLSTKLFNFFQSKTAQGRKLALSHLRVHVDKPNSLFTIVNDSFVISGWAVDLNNKSAAELRVRIGKTEYQLYETQREDVQRVFANICTLPLEVGFCSSPSLSIGIHSLWIDVLDEDANWIPIHRSFLFRKPQNRFKKVKRALSYQDWIYLEQNKIDLELTEIEQHIELMIHKPKFSVIIDTRQNLTDWEDGLLSVRKQIYHNYEVFVQVNAISDFPLSLATDVKPFLDANLIHISGDYIVFIQSGQQLARNALYEFANVINQAPETDLVYGDEDCVNDSGVRTNPFYKPDWSPDYLETFNYIGFTACFRSSIAIGCLTNTDSYDFVLRFTERTTKIYHLAKILGHKQNFKNDNEEIKRVSKKNIASLKERIQRTGRQGTVSQHQSHPGCYDIQLSLKRQPLISIIIPTAGKVVTVGERQIDLISNVIDQIRSQSTYKNIEIIVVDNGDLSENQYQEITHQACKRITYTDSVLNISKKLNLGASIAEGEFLLLMNDDIEIITSNWIERMLEHFEKPHVGVVGAKLLYPDKRIQHAGVAHNNGNPDHVRRLYPRDEAGYFFSTCGVRNFMAVTGAAMLTSAKTYHSVGGYSEELAVSYNDTDYCLKVREVGLSIVYAPKVELIHMESQSRVASADFREVLWYQKRWAEQIIFDNYYNEHFLTVASPTFVPHINSREI